MTDQDLLSILGENAQSKNLTAKKTNEIMQRDKSVITGFVVTDPYGNIGIVDKSVVQSAMENYGFLLSTPLYVFVPASAEVMLFKR